MTAYIIRRAIIGIVVLLIVTMLVFLFMRLLPGDPLLVYMAGYDVQRAQKIGIEEYNALKHQWGLDKPIYVQYIDWIKNILRGDLGKSIKLQQSITSLIADAMPRTAYIGFISFVIGTVLGIIFGVICALRRGTWIDNLITTVSNIGITVPTFWLGILMIYILSYKMHWLPTSGWTSPTEDFVRSTKQIIMPVICLSVGGIAGLARLTRSCMLEVMRQDYVRTAWSKGLRERVIVFRHQIKNAIIPIVTTLGGALAGILGGSVIIETVFAIPGMGRLMTTAIFDQDYQIVQAGVLIFGAIIIFSNLLVDVAYAWIDPRIRYS